MSSDNFYVVKGNKVWMGDASEHMEAEYAAEVRFFRRLLRRKPIFVGKSSEEARRWADSEYAEYGVYPLPAELEDKP